VHMCALSRKQTLMSMTCRHNASRINMACAARPVRLLIGLALLAAPVATFADMTQLQHICTVARLYARGAG
jgi:hypothetical protein